jgi:hypothetical protein
MALLNAGDTAPAGDYTCDGCGSTIRLLEERPLPACDNCQGTVWEEGGRPGREPKPVGSI